MADGMPIGPVHVGDALAHNLLRLRIRCLLLVGRLPREPQSERLETPARGEFCAACAREIGRADLDIELHFTASHDGTAVHLHPACEATWNAERTAIIDLVDGPALHRPV